MRDKRILVTVTSDSACSARPIVLNSNQMPASEMGRCFTGREKKSSPSRGKINKIPRSYYCVLQA